MKSKFSRSAPAILAWVILLATTGTFFAIVAPGLMKEFRPIGYVLTAGEVLLFIAVVANFLMVTVMDPGVLPRATESEEQQQDEFRAPLYKNTEVKGISVRMKWCTTCHFYRPPRCSHCSVCDHCIDIFDHHCPWLNNCIGRRNYRQFFIYLILMTVHTIAVFVMCLFYTLKMKDNLLTKENLASIVIMIITGFFISPIMGLTGFHCFLVVTGRTTNEQVTGKFRSGYNPFNKGICRNLAFVCCGPQFPRFADYAGKQEAVDLERMYRADTKFGGVISAKSPLMNTDGVSVNNHRLMNSPGVDPNQIHMYAVDGRGPVVLKKQQPDSKKFEQPKIRPNDISSECKSATPAAISILDKSRGSFASRSRSSVGDQQSDDISLGRTTGDDMSRDSSMVTIRVFPKSGSVGFPPLLRPGDPDGGTSSLEAQGSKCNLLDETGSALDAPGTLYTKRPMGGGDAKSNYDDRYSEEEFISSPGNDRYQQALREAYSGSVVRHKPPVAIKSAMQPLPMRSANGPMTSSYGGGAMATTSFGGGDGIPRFAYVPPSSLMKSSVVNKSHSMDALGRQGGISTLSSSTPHHHHHHQPTPMPRLTLAPTMSSSVAADYNYSGYKRPLSFTQAVQLHDSLTRLNNNNSNRSADSGVYVSRPRSDTAGSASASTQSSNVNEIRV